MVSATKTRRVVCTVIRVSEFPDAISNRLATKPSALVPWADPYIAGLVRRLQSEVRLERASLGVPAGDEGSGWDMFDQRGAAIAQLSRSAVADLEPPSPALDTDFDWRETPRWTVDGEPAE